MRLRTLPLSMAGVCLGVSIAVADGYEGMLVPLLIMSTTVCLQILSNLSNELGDVLSGTDRADRKGPQYGLSTGSMTIRDMKFLTGIFVGLCILSGLAMTFASFGTLFSKEAVVLEMLGAAAIVGGMKYTLGRNPYGYRGWGDISVFIFFGLVSVAGAYYVTAHSTGLWPILLPACSIGLLCVGVLNVNNIRDMATDVKTRKTVAIRLGLRGARIYQTILVALGLALISVYGFVRPFSVWNFLMVPTFPLFIRHVRGVWSLKDGELDSMLPLLVISTFLLSLLAGFGYLIAD